jgi:two-component system, LytTR family, sensor histidine kinase AlgZ
MASVSKRPDSGISTFFGDLREVVTATDRTSAAALAMCNSGVLLRALLLVHGVLGLGLLYGGAGAGAWLQALSEAATVSMPATSLWLLVVCAGRHQLVRWAPALQLMAVAVLGAGGTALVWSSLHLLALAPGGRTPELAPLLTGAALAMLIYQIERWRTRASLPAAAAARLADLQTRIRPHFLFNTLNSAITLVQHNPRQAEELLENLSDLFRAALGEMEKPTTVAAEVALSQRYLAIEQLRFGHRLEVEWDLDPAAAGAKLPALALQPLIENAVRHGVEPSDRGGVIEVRTRRRRDRVLISVTNSMPAGPSRPGHGIGLASVRERLRLMHDLEADFRSGVIEDGRWRVSIGVPA